MVFVKKNLHFAERNGHFSWEQADAHGHMEKILQCCLSVLLVAFFGVGPFIWSIPAINQG